MDSVTQSITDLLAASPMLRGDLPVIQPLLGWLVDPGLDQLTVILMGAVLAALGVAFIAGIILQRQPDSTLNPAVVRAFNQRVRGWWLMFIILTAAFFMGRVV